MDRAGSPIDVDLYEDVDDASAEQNEVGPQLEDIEQWRDRIRSQSGGNTFKMTAPTAQAASPAFIHLVNSLVSGTAPYEYEPDNPLLITCTIWSIRALLTPLRPFYL